MNRRQYEQYVCKRIPNKQAVVVMACDNMHMSDDMILEFGDTCDIDPIIFYLFQQKSGRK